MSWSSWLLDVWEGGVNRALQYLPTETASAIGAFIVRQNVRFALPHVAQGARRNLAQHCPELDGASLDAGVRRFVDNVGRFMGEFSVLHRFFDEGRVEMIGFEPILEIAGREPLVSVTLHTGNWEALGPGLKSLGLRVATFYEIPTTQVRRNIVEQARVRVGFDLLTPDINGLRQALRFLGQNRIVAIFGDEARDGKTMAPLFGRPPHDKGNLAIAARLARAKNSRLVVAHAVRLPNCRFRLYVTPPFHLPAESTSPLDDVAYLNSRIEPVILANLDQWYYLDDAITPIE